MERKYCAWLKMKGIYAVESYCKDVHVGLFRQGFDYEKEKTRYNFEKLIKDYQEDQKTDNGKKLILEYFTKKEIDGMKSYFEHVSFPQIDFFYEEIAFPIDARLAPVGTLTHEDCWLCDFQVTFDYARQVEVGGYVMVRDHNNISRKPKEDLFEKYNLFYAFENVLGSTFFPLDEDKHYLTATNAGEMLEGFTALLLIKKGTHKFNAVTLQNKIRDWINEEDVLMRLDKSNAEIIERSSFDNIL